MSAALLTGMKAGRREAEAENGGKTLVDLGRHMRIERDKEWNHLKWVPTPESEMRTAWAAFLAVVDRSTSLNLRPSLPTTVGASRL